MLQILAKTERYWTEQFEVTDEDVEHIFNVFLETEIPLASRDLARHLIKTRIERESSKLRRQIERGEVFQPKNPYKVGDQLIFPALGYASGRVISERPGHNPEHGTFSVIGVALDDGQTIELACNLSTPHALNINGDQALDDEVSDEEIAHLLREYGDDIVYMLEERLRAEPDAVYFAGKWFLKSLLADISIAHLHLAEAVLVMHEGGPLDTKAILGEIGLPQEVNPRLQVFSLDYALFQDERFDEVGPAGKVLWYLRELEPPEVQSIPERLRYEPIEYDWRALSDELLALEREIDDELSNTRSPAQPADSVTFSLNYPHRRSGTLPLSSRLRHMFPTAYEAPRVLMTLVDAQTGEEMNGWVVREHRYVCGLAALYQQHKLPVGTYITIRRTEDPSRVAVDFYAHRPRTEWIRIAVPQDNGRLTFENHKRSIGADYDDLMALGVDDLAGLDELWIRAGARTPDLSDTVRLVMGELARLSPQRTVHARTLYSAVNMIRRCPPGPIFATLMTRPEFQHVGGPYWGLS